jgi:diguanylate cyclase (GGDEF)-like protein
VTGLDFLVESDTLEAFNEGFSSFGLRFWLVDAQHRPLAGEPPQADGARYLPLQVAGQSIGYLAVSEQPGPSTPEQQQQLIAMVMSRLEKEASLRYELQNTLEELISKYEELTVLYESAETVATVMNLEEVSRRILDQAAEILEVDHASLMLLSEESSDLEVVAARGLRSDTAGKVRVPLGEGISGTVAETGQAILIEDLSSHPVYSRDSRAEQEWTSLISVPLKVRDRVLGVLNVNNKKSGAPFTSGDLKMLMALAQLAAISIQNARTYQNAITDRLTSLYNYGYFREQLDRTIEQCREQNETLSLLMFDIDHFKNFNDVNGHELGNVALVGVASLCMVNSRQAGDRVPDLVARYGGEEFMILLRGVTPARAMEVAERVRVRVESEHFPGGENQPFGKVTISIGVACFPVHAQTGDELINKADEALYEAKRGGRNRVCIA